jgi:hypothetical protein
VLPPGMPGPRKSKIKLALGIGVPLGIVIGSALSSRRKPANPQASSRTPKGTSPPSPAPRHPAKLVVVALPQDHPHAPGATARSSRPSRLAVRGEV